MDVARPIAVPQDEQQRQQVPLLVSETPRAAGSETVATTSCDYRRFVLPDRVDSRIFTDSAIFDDEIVKIFESEWVYVAHESEVPHSGDYVTRQIGLQPVIVVRGADESVRVLLNRCRHRGTALCREDRGNAKFFRCPYHGWTYDGDGRLVGVPYPGGYGPEFDKSDFSLTPVPSVAEYRGFIFASVRPPSMQLDEWLGGRVRAVIDAFVDASPEGRITVRAGAQHTAFRGNWKYVGMDGYHVNFTHRSLIALAEEKGELVGGEDFDERSSGRAWDFGNGHCRLDKNYDDEYRRQLIERVRASPDGGEYVTALETRWGSRTAELLAVSRDPHLGVWPNLQLIGTHVRVIQPIAPDQTVVTLHATQLEGAPPEINEQRLQAQTAMFGPAGFIQPDDSELFERNHVGLQARVDPWLYLGRGREREVENPDGAIAGHITDETTQRGQMKMWLRQMCRVDGLDRMDDYSSTR